MREPEEVAEERALIFRQLARRVSTLPETVKNQINSFSPIQLESLAEAMFDVETLTDLENWLAQNLDRE
jgi:hypothetical protein